MKRNLYLLLLLIGMYVAGQRHGYTKQKAIELDSLHLQKVEKQIDLMKLLQENSGLQYVDGAIYTFNDSGGEAAVYKIDSETGELLQTIVFKKVKNVDFEDIAFDGKNLYVGDFGNNLGKRDLFYIYNFNLSKISEEQEKVELKPKEMRFVIDEQSTDTPDGPLTTNFDIEAMTFHNGKIHFFTKEWSNNKTTHYSLEPDFNFQAAKKIETFNTKCVVTASDIVDDELFMTGYTVDGQVYLWKFWNFSDGKFFNGESKQYSLGWSPEIGQIEGVTIGGNYLFISGEDFSNFGLHTPQKLYTLKLEEIQ